MSKVQHKRVIVAVDPAKRPEDPLRLGAELAPLLGAPLELVAGFPYLPVLQDRDDEDAVELRRAARDDLLALGRELARVEVVDAHVHASNAPARMLQEVSERDDAGLLVLGSTTRGPLRRTLLGTVGGRLAEGGACPLAVAPHGYGDAPARVPRAIGVAYDGSDESRRALDAATGLARRAGARLRIITVHQPVAFGGLPTSLPEAEVSVNRALEDDARRLHEEAVRAAQGDLDADGAFRSGRPADVLSRASAELDLLVAGSRGYGPVGAVLLGSTTHDLLRTAACPLLLTPRGTRLDVGP
ncbi:MAG: universal stress protein [Solirubrobacterales bacterium]|nr:universal stress protein [Solirubrobacterales bacterium]